MNSRMKREQGHLRFWIFFAMLSAMIFARYGLQIGIPRVLALVPIIAIALQGNQTEILAICMCLIPLHESLDFYYALVLVIAIYVLKYYRRIRVDVSFILLILIIIWELLHCFTPDFSPVIFVGSLAPTIALIVILCSDFSDLNYAFVVRAVAAAAIVVCITMLVQIAWISRFRVTTFLATLRRLGALSETSADALEISGGMVQTNSLGVICVMITACLLQLRQCGEGKRRDVFVMLMLLIFGTFTASRTFLVCLALMIILVLLGQKGAVRKMRYFGIAILTVVLIVLLFAVFFPDQLEYYISRFFESDITTGRITTMSQYNEFIQSNIRVIIFGIGLQDYTSSLVQEYSVASVVPHNCIQEIIIVWGVPGIVLIALVFLRIIAKSKQLGKKQELVNYIPLIIIVIKSQAGQLLTSPYSMLALSYSYLSLCYTVSSRAVKKSIDD